MIQPWPCEWPNEQNETSNAHYQCSRAERALSNGREVRHSHHVTEGVRDDSSSETSSPHEQESCVPAKNSGVEKLEAHLHAERPGWFQVCSAGWCM